MKNARTAKMWLLHTFILADREKAFTSLGHNNVTMELFRGFLFFQLLQNLIFLLEKLK